MIVIQDCGKDENHGTIMAKGATREKALAKLKKDKAWIFDPETYGRENLEVTHDENYIYINGKAEYKFEQI